MFQHSYRFKSYYLHSHYESIYFLKFNIMWLFFNQEKSDDEKLKEQIEEVVKSAKVWYYDLYNWVNINHLWFDIYLETNRNEDSLYNCKVKYKNEELYNKNDSTPFMWRLVNIIKRKKKELEKLKKEKDILNRKLLISEALAVLSTQYITNASQEVKDEFDPIFTKVKRVMEITKELEGIRKEFSIT